MEIRQLNTFVKIVQLQSFSKAAHELGYSQSAVTIQIGLLEKELNARLFDRMGKRVTLTPPGKQFLQYANDILKQINDAQTALGKLESLEQTLHIGTIESLCFSKFPKLLQYFYKHHPQVSIKITTDSPKRLIEMMEHNQVDIIYILDYPIYNNNWVKVMERQEYIVFVSSVLFPLAKSQMISLAELIDKPFFLTEKEDNYRHALNQHLASKNMEIRPFLELGNTEFIINMVKNNLGLSFLPHFAVNESVMKNELSILNITDFQMSMSRQIFYHKDKWMTKEMQEFIRLANLGMV
jgi:DNA-binding transcriptional LysR family regulator